MVLLHIAKVVRCVLTRNPSTHAVSVGWSFECLTLELKRLDFESCKCLNRTGSCDVHERIKAILAICQDGKPL